VAARVVRARTAAGARDRLTGEEPVVWGSMSRGAVRAGLVHYNDRSDVDRLLAAVAELG
jgi:selenocysteine lyase/cysteine desulfurase